VGGEPPARESSPVHANAIEYGLVAADISVVIIGGITSISTQLGAQSNYLAMFSWDGLGVSRGLFG
jgi:hypothetical protein